ncbi:C40 family peptidase [Amycolatopsis sacchari]|uniref:C40 family peptidase n=1 Tax=Amycolatopsis sacchari TaxID=115433 RepID=UPI003EBBD905
MKTIAVLAAALALGTVPAYAAEQPSLEEIAVQAQTYLERAQGELARSQADLDNASATAAAVERQAADSAAASAAAERAAADAHAEAARWRTSLGGSGRVVFEALPYGKAGLAGTADSLPQLLSAVSMLDRLTEGTRRSTAAATERAEQASRTAERARQDAGTVARQRDQALARRSEAQRRRDTAAELVTGGEQYLQEVLRRLVLSVQQELQQQGSGARPDGTAVPGAAGTAVRFALAQLGKPYVWGAEGPAAYDCSGLVLAAYHAAGLALPRTSAEQSQVGTAVPRDQVRAGDLVFYYQPVSHVAIALDGQHAVHAPTVGRPVQVAAIDAIGPLTVIRRIG